EATGITTPVLFWLQGPRREANLRARLASRPAAHHLPIATACPSALVDPGDDSPAGRFWLPLDIGSSRCRLAALTHTWPQTTSNKPAHTS
ncbi:hypothetical protein AB0L06_41695, partial [Spirillospora sp. NPDC052269]